MMTGLHVKGLVGAFAGLGSTTSAHLADSATPFFADVPWPVSLDVETCPRLVGGSS